MVLLVGAAAWYGQVRCYNGVTVAIVVIGGFGAAGVGLQWCFCSVLKNQV